MWRKKHINIGYIVCGIGPRYMPNGFIWGLIFRVAFWASSPISRWNRSEEAHRHVISTSRSFHSLGHSGALWEWCSGLTLVYAMTGINDKLYELKLVWRSCPSYFMCLLIMDSLILSLKLWVFIYHSEFTQLILYSWKGGPTHLTNALLQLIITWRLMKPRY